MEPGRRGEPNDSSAQCAAPGARGGVQKWPKHPGKTAENTSDEGDGGVKIRVAEVCCANTFLLKPAFRMCWTLLITYSNTRLFVKVAKDYSCFF